jgi:hypothetical protein
VVEEEEEEEEGDIILTEEWDLGILMVQEVEVEFLEFLVLEDLLLFDDEDTFVQVLHSRSLVILDSGIIIRL